MGGRRAGFLEGYPGVNIIPQNRSVIRHLSTGGTVWSRLFKLVGRALICQGGVVKVGRCLSQGVCSQMTRGEAIWMVGWPDFWRVMWRGQNHALK